MSSQERIEAVVAELAEVVAEMAASATERAQSAEREASVQVGRYGEAVADLADARARIREYELEREGIPNRAYRAGLDERWEREDELKERYRNLAPAIAALAEQIASLEAEIVALAGPNRLGPEGTAYDAEVLAYVAVRDVYSEGASPIVEVERQVRRIMRDAVEPLTAAHRYWGQTLQGIRDQRHGSPEMAEARAEKRARGRAGAKAKV